MPFRLNVPLPGPLSYSRRIGGGAHRAGAHGALWWLLIGCWWFPIKWITFGVAWCYVITARLSVLLWKLAVR